MVTGRQRSRGKRVIEEVCSVSKSDIRGGRSTMVKVSGEMRTDVDSCPSSKVVNNVSSNLVSSSIAKIVVSGIAIPDKKNRRLSAEKSKKVRVGKVRPSRGEVADGNNEGTVKSIYFYG